MMAFNKKSKKDIYLNLNTKHNPTEARIFPLKILLVTQELIDIVIYNEKYQLLNTVKMVQKYSSDAFFIT